MPFSIPIHKAGRIIRNGGIVSYPTEGVFGLGCLPNDIRAIERILTIKHRSPAQGFILIAANSAQLRHWVDTDLEIPSDPHTPLPGLLRQALLCRRGSRVNTRASLFA